MSPIQVSVPCADGPLAGVVLLLQSYHLRTTGRLPSVADILRWLAQGSVSITDGDDEHDNVLHTGLPFRRVDALAALTACAKSLVVSELAAAGMQIAPKPASVRVL